MSPLKTFAFHKPSPEGVKQIEALRWAYHDLLCKLEALCPASREKALAVTNLEQSCMWATKSVTHNDPQSTVES